MLHAFLPYIVSTLLVFSCSSVVIFGSPSSSDDFLSNWQGVLASVINNATILDISLPGTHDTLTYDLSVVPSVGAWDGHDFLSELLHSIFELVDKVPPMDELGGWIRTQSQTHLLNITQQLDGGIRFIDFRNMYSTEDLIKFDWFGLHFLQTNGVALQYLKEIRQWLDNHPTEWIVMWVSKHGSTSKCGDDQYPNVSIEVKQKYWNEFVQLFADIIVDTQRFPINSTSIGTLLQNNQRVLVLASDWAEFSSSSPYALDAKLYLDNETPDIGNIGTDVPNLVNYFQNTLPQVMTNNKQNSIFTLMSLAGAPQGDQGIASFFLRFLPLTPKVDEKQCAKGFGIPNMVDFCPLRLIDVSYLNNYYSQYVFESALQNLVMPNAIYIDGVDAGGTIHTGVGDNDTRSYAYSDTILLINVNRLCNKNPQVQCQSFQDLLSTRRQHSPIQLWNDANGRNANWPTFATPQLA